MSAHQQRFTIAPAIELSLATPLNLDRLWDDFVAPTLFFVTFCTGEPNAIREITVIPKLTDTTEYTRPVTVIISKWRQVRTGASDSRPSTHLLPFSVVEDRFQEICAAWYRIEAEQKIPLLEFFAVFLDERMFLDEAFLRIVRALESWHRNRFGGTMLAPDEFDQMLRQIKQVLSTAEWDLVKMRLAYGNELTLKRRLEDLIKKAGEPIEQIMQGGYEHFGRRVVETRNYLAHGGLKKVAVYSDEEMIWARKTLQLIFLISVLDALGLSEEAPELIRRTHLFRTLGDSFNVLAKPTSKQELST